MSVRGVFAAAATPLLAEDLVRYASHVTQLIADGCDGIAVLGTRCRGSAALERCPPLVKLRDERRAELAAQLNELGQG